MSFAKKEQATTAGDHSLLLLPTNIKNRRIRFRKGYEAYESTISSGNLSIKWHFDQDFDNHDGQ